MFKLPAGGQGINFKVPETLFGDFEFFSNSTGFGEEEGGSEGGRKCVRGKDDEVVDGFRDGEPDEDIFIFAGALFQG